MSSYARAVYIIEWILFTLCTIILIGSSTYVTVIYHDEVNGDNSTNSGQQDQLEQDDRQHLMYGMWILTGIAIAVQAGLNVLLTSGVNSKSHCGCQTWFILQILMLVLGTFFGLLFVMMLLPVYVVYSVYRILTLVVIKNFMSEIMIDSRMDQGFVNPSYYKNFA